MSSRWKGQENSASNNNQDIEGQGDSMKETTTQRTILGLIWNKIVQWWNRHVAFVLLCVIEVAMDPLFFYLPMINLKKKCIGFDKKLWIIAIVVRSVNDFIYLLHFIWQFRTVFIYKTKLRYLWPFLLDILVILPIPQVVIPIIFSEMSGSKSSKKLKVLNFIAFFQYGPRIFQIYRSWKRLISSDKKFDRNIPFKAPLNLILYIFAGHVLGAFWYFFSSQRLTSCWRIACEKHSECVQSSFNCDHSFGNDLSFLNDSCPIDPPNTKSFDFGIFHEALQSHVSESTDFPQKLFYSFWWGMRNLSSFGTNLQTSNYIWENCFALCISIFGLMLFLFFMGNLQMYMQWTTSKSINNWKKDLKRKKQEKNIESWMSKKALPSEMTKQIMEHIPKRYDEDEDVYVENLIPDLPPKLQGEVKHHICYDLLKNVLGAFWYLFSAQRLMACWKIVCENHSGCGRSSFKCDHNFEDLSFLNDMCHINSTNATPFNFGIFLDALQSGVLESTNFPQKLFYSFWWGMRNLSSLGQNLQTSNYIWENFFALSISITGLLLFLYFLGNLQMFMQWTTSKPFNKLENVRKKMRMKPKNQIAELWFTKYDLPSKMKSDITANIYRRFEEGEDVYVENLIPGFPVRLQNDIKRHICLNLLKQLNIIKESGLAKRERLLLKICDSLRPVFYNEHSYIIREGDPIDAVFLITSGIVWCTTSRNIGEEETASRHAERLDKGQFFGGELIEWVWKPSSVDMYNLSRLPVSSKTLKTHKKVEAFVLMAEDFRKIVYSKLSRFGPERSEFKAACTLQGAWHRRPRVKNKE